MEDKISPIERLLGKRFSAMTDKELSYLWLILMLVFSLAFGILFSFGLYLMELSKSTLPPSKNFRRIALYAFLGFFILGWPIITNLFQRHVGRKLRNWWQIFKK